MSWHESLPWLKVRQWYHRLRALLFTIPRPDGTYYVVENEEPVRYMEKVLGRASFAPNWEFSYNKKGEDLNLARVEYAPHPIRAGSGLEWMQVHVRGWADGNRIELTAHYEAEPTEHPHAHLDGKLFSREKGLHDLAQVLDTAGVEYEEFQR